MYQTTGDVSKEFILSRISEEDIFYKYLGIYPNIDEYFTNPLRADKHPDCRFYRDGRGVLKFKDYAWGVNWDCFNVVQKVEKDVNNFYDALRKVIKDFNLYNEEINFDVIADFEQKIILSKRNTQLQVKRRDWYEFDIKWWAENCTDNLRALNFFNVAPLQNVWVGDDIIYTYDRKDPAYVFWFGDRNYKIYYPLRDKGRFMNNRSNLLQGYNQLPDSGETLIITKSYKDVICMRTFGFHAVAPMSESIMITVEQYEDLNNRFFKIYSLMDRDRAGMRMAQMLRKTYNIEPLLFPSDGILFRLKEEPKDFTDHVFAKGYGTPYVLELIEQIRNNE